MANDSLKIIKQVSDKGSTVDTVSGSTRDAYIEAVSSGAFSGTYADFIKAQKGGKKT